MSHRKFEAPRRGHLGYLPRKRARRGRGRVRSFPKDNKDAAPHLTAFIGYKAGMTHIMRDFQKVGQKVITIEVIEAVTVVETPPMVVIGVTGYTETPFGLKCLTTVWTRHISNSAKRRFAKKWHKKHKNVFRRNTLAFNDELMKKNREAKIALLEEKADIVRLIAHTQISKVSVGAKKAHVIEIQINGGSAAEKVKFAVEKFEKTISFEDVFKLSELVDVISINKGSGFKGVVSRWGVSRLPRKTHKGLRKVACIGAWHPSRVRYTVARAGQKGYHHRTERNKKVYLIGKKFDREAKNESQSIYAAATANDLTKKSINPLGGFPNYGRVKEDFVVLKGSIPGVSRRPITFRKTIYPQTSKRATEDIPLKFIDTSSKIGRGRFQTFTEKRKFMGKLKKDKLREQKRKLKISRRKKKVTN